MTKKNPNASPAVRAVVTRQNRAIAKKAHATLAARKEVTKRSLARDWDTAIALDKLVDLDRAELARQAAEAEAARIASLPRTRSEVARAAAHKYWARFRQSPEGIAMEAAKAAKAAEPKRSLSEVARANANAYWTRVRAAEAEARVAAEQEAAAKLAAEVEAREAAEALAKKALREAAKAAKAKALVVKAKKTRKVA